MRLDFARVSSIAIAVSWFPYDQRGAETWRPCRHQVVEKYPLTVSAKLPPWRPPMSRTKQSLPSSPEAPWAAGSSKVEAVIALLETGQGTTLNDIIERTSWQPHTARAMLSGLKKKGNNIQLEKVSGISRYRIIKGATQ